MLDKKWQLFNTNSGMFEKNSLTRDKKSPFPDKNSVSWNKKSRMFDK